MKTTTKLLSIILAMLLCLGVLPITAFAYYEDDPHEIYEAVRVNNIIEPVAGQQASFNCSVPEGKNYYVSSVTWIEYDDAGLTSGRSYDKNSEPSLIFKPDKYYTVACSVIPSGGYYFLYCGMSIINGKIGEARYPYSGVSTKQPSCNVWYFFGKPAISSINVTKVVPPLIGATASFNWSIPSEGGYVKDGTQNSAWIETSTPPTTYDALCHGTYHWNTDGSFNFDVNKYYTFAAFVKESDGCSFTSSLTAEMNYNTARVTSVNNYKVVWYCFGKPAISSITVTGVTSPVAGATASFNWSIPSGSGYVKDGAQNSAWVETDTKPNTIEALDSGTFHWNTNGSFTFNPNKYYTFCVYVIGENGCTIPESLNAKINNNYAICNKQRDSLAVWYCFGKPTVTKTLSSITVTTQPTKKAYTAGQSFDKSGMVVKANYSDGTSATITNYTVTNGNNLPVGRTSVTVSYTEGGVTKTTTVPITVNAITATLTGIEITSAPSVTELKYKSTAQTDGLKVTAKYSDGSTKDVTDKVTVKNFSATNKKGAYKATVEFEGMSATFDYTVKYSFGQWLLIILLFGWIWY